MPNAVVLASVVTIWSLSFAYFARQRPPVYMFFIFPKTFFAPLPNSLVHFSLLVFGVVWCFPKISVGLWPCTVSPRDLISVYCSNNFNFSIASNVSSFNSVPISSNSCLSHFVWFMKVSHFFASSVSYFSSLFKTSNSFFTCSCLFSRVTTIMSSKHGVQNQSVRSICS